MNKHPIVTLYDTARLVKELQRGGMRMCPDCLSWVANTRDAATFHGNQCEGTAAMVGYRGTGHQRNG